MTHTCTCDGPGLCPRFGKDMGPRHHQICSGVYPPGAKALPENIRAKYVVQWAAGRASLPVILRRGGSPGAKPRKP